MRSQRTLVIAVLLGLLIAVGSAEAAERGTSERATSLRGAAPATAQIQSVGSLSLSKILRARFLQTWKMLAELDDARSEPPVFGTNGLSDGPDPIDGSGQAGGTTPPPVKDEGSDSSQDGGGGSSDDEGTSFNSTN